MKPNKKRFLEFLKAWRNNCCSFHTTICGESLCRREKECAVIEKEIYKLIVEFPKWQKRAKNSLKKLEGMDGCYAEDIPHSCLEIIGLTEDILDFDFGRADEREER